MAVHRVMRVAPSAVRSLLGIASALAAAAPSSIPVSWRRSGKEYFLAQQLPGLRACRVMCCEQQQEIQCLRLIAEPDAFVPGR